MENNRLVPGYKITTFLGKEMTVCKTIGAGGSGVVYQVEYDGYQKAFKQFYPSRSDILIRRKWQDYIEQGAPSPSFLCYCA